MTGRRPAWSSGTEAALHRVDHAGLVVFLDFDQHLLAPRFGAAEEALALLARAARLVGARAGSGRVLVQTRIPGPRGAAPPPSTPTPGLLADAERPVRRQLGLPPFGALAMLRGPGRPRLRRRTCGAVPVARGVAAGRRPVPGPGRRPRVLCDGLAAVPRPAEPSAGRGRPDRRLTDRAGRRVTATAPRRWPDVYEAVHGSMSYAVRTYGDPVLRQVAKPIDDVDGALVKLVDDMVETMYEAVGAGLAAPQVGVQRRLFVYELDDGPKAVINPEIVESSAASCGTTRPACPSRACASASSVPRRCCSRASTSTATN